VIRPHKEAALAKAGSATPGSERAGAANLLVRGEGTWRAANTSGVVDPLILAGVEPARRAAAVVGCGGAGRSIAAELRRFGARVTLINRGAPRGEFASRLLDLPWISLRRFSPREFDLIVNATPLDAESPFDVGELADDAVVVDLVYLADRETALMAAVRARGLPAVNGRQVLVAELGRQFQLMTGCAMPAEAAALARGRHHRRAPELRHAEAL
jgi:3-dehydroquinate dehydratase / shikimate dehydrogenase